MKSDLTPGQLNALKWKVFEAVKSGRCGHLSSVLAGLSDQVIKRVLRERFYHFQDFLTPLEIAASSGDTQIVQLLLEKFRDFTEIITSGATDDNHTHALHCATLRGHLDIVKLLAAKGADINTVDFRGRTALHLACDSDHFKLVKYFIDMGAKTDIADSEDNTCLARACKPGRGRILRLLLEKGVDPNQRSPLRRTALHAAAEWNVPKAAKMLLKHGAILCKDSRGHNPLMRGIVLGCTECVDVLLQSSLLTLNERVDALELMGAMAAEKDTDLAYEYLHTAMQHRYENPSAPILKSRHQPVQILGDFVESQTLEELESRRLNHKALQLESLLIYERLIGAKVFSTVLRYCRVFCYLRDQHFYGDALTLWNHSRRAHQEDCPSHLTASDVLGVFEDMLRHNISPLFSQVENVLNLFLETIGQTGAFIPVGTVQEIYVKYNIFNCLSCIIIASKIVESQHHIERLHEMVERFIALCKSVWRDYSILHFALLMLTSPTSFDPTTEVTCASLLSLLLHCGADIDATDSGGNTALHKAVAYGAWMDCSVDIVCDIARCLLEHGAHVDVRNKDGQSPLDCCATNEVRAILQEYQPVSLLCLAASAVVRLEIPYQDQVPKMVQKYITLHYPGQVCPSETGLEPS